MIRQMEEKDIAAVQKIAHESWSDTYAGIIPQSVQTAFLNQAYSDAMMHERLRRTSLFVAEVENEVVGFANFTKVDEDGDAELTAIYLLPAYQKQGIGHSLLQTGLQELKGKEANQLFVYVEADNLKGCGFYEASGFEFVERFEEEFAGHMLQTVKYVYYVKTPVR